MSQNDDFDEEIKQVVETTKQIIEDGHSVEDAVEIILNDTACKKGKFANFWAATEALLNEGESVADERRHGTVNCIAPTFISLRDFHERAQQRMQLMFNNDPNNAVPSEEYFR